MLSESNDDANLVAVSVPAEIPLSPKKFPQSVPLFWGAISIFAIAVGGLLVPVPYQGRVAGSLSDLMHAPSFAVLTCVALLLLATFAHQPRLLKRWLAVGMVMLVGAVMEFMQQFSGRNPDWHDIYANGLGATAGWFLFESWLTSSRALRWPLSLTAILLIGIATLRPAVSLYDVYSQHRDFPMLGTFENDRQLAHWHARHAQVERSPRYATHGQWSARLLMSPGDYPAFMLFHLPRDWSNYERLSLDLVLGEEGSATNAKAILKIADLDHDEAENALFEQEIALTSGQAVHVEVALSTVEQSLRSGTLNLRAIRYLEIQLPEITGPTEIFLDNVRLSNFADSISTSRPNPSSVD